MEFVCCKHHTNVGFQAFALCMYFTLQYILPLFGYAHDLRKYGALVYVTGYTDGIGLQYAFQLASKGFDIVFINRSKEKLETVSKEIIAKFLVKTKKSFMISLKLTVMKILQKNLRI